MADEPATTSELRCGRFRVDLQARALWVDGEPAKVGARAFDILLALAQRRTRVVSKNELLDIVWPNLVVEENNLQVHISALRKLLGADVIATIPGRGYRFAAALDDDGHRPAPAPGAAVHPTTNLPLEQAPLYGRDGDVAAVRALMQAHRLVTISGAGGIGKSRVALAVAHALQGHWADGAWLVELAPLADAALVPASVAQALRMPLRGVREPADELVDALQAQQLLLVLDNCEHLIGEVSRLVQALLVRTPQLRLLVTSQEPLRLPGEHLFRLDTLGLPPPDADVAQALGCGAVRLFVERVQALDPRFVFGEHNAAAVIEVARRLDGLALALELAAARVPALGVQGVRDRLQARLRVLTAGARIALRRYQTLRAALDWSFGLLDADEQAVFRRLGVFSGGCTIEAAQAVAADDARDEWAVLDIVARLVDKSLVVADGDDRPRYRLLESARAYALEQLAAADETDALSRRHAAYYGALFEQLADGWYAGRVHEDDFLGKRALELDNVRAALGWALGEHGDTDIALALLAHTAPVSLVLPLHDESERWCETLSQQLHAAPASPLQAAWNQYLQVHWRLLRLRAIERGRAAMRFDATALRPLADGLRQAHALYIVALHATWIGDLDAARLAIAEASPLERARWPAWLWVLHTQVHIRVRHLAGEAPSARADLHAMLARLQAAGEAEGRSAFVVHTDIAIDCVVQGRFDEAWQRLEQLADLGRRLRRDPHRMSVLMAHWVLAATELGRLDEARALVQQALPWLRRTGMWGVYAPVLALAAARRGDAAAAARLMGAGDAQLASSGLARSLVERRAAVQVRALVVAAHGERPFDAWVAEGAGLDEAAFMRLAAGDDR